MAVIVVGQETTFGDLERRLFTGGPSDAVIRRFRKQLRELNPDVDFNLLRPGLVLRLPQLPELRRAADLTLDDSIKDGVAAVRQRLRTDLEEFGDAARRRLRDEAADRSLAAKQLGSREVQDVAGRDEAVGEAVKAAAEGIAEDEAADERRRAVLEQAITEWTDELAALDRAVH